MATTTFGVGVATNSHPVDAVVEAVADVTGRNPLALEPLYDTVDPEALEAFLDFEPLQEGTTRRVAFSYADCDVTVRSDGVVEVSRDGTTRTRRWTR